MAPTLSPTFPPPPATVSNNETAISVWLNTPTRVQRTVEDFTTQRFVADQIFGTGPRAQGGGVVYDQVTGQLLYTDADVESIRPGGGFPRVGLTGLTPKAGAVEKFGGEVPVTREHKLRSNWSAVNRALTDLRNTVTRKVDTQALAVLAAAPIQTHSGVDLTSATSAQILASLVVAKGLIDNLEMNYMADTLVLNPVNADELLSNENFVKLLQLDTPNARVVRDANLGRILDMEIYKSPRVTLGTGFLVDSGRIGGVSDEEPLSTNVYEDPHSQTTYVQAWRTFVPYVTDPKAAVSMSGL